MAPCWQVGNSATGTQGINPMNTVLSQDGKSLIITVPLNPQPPLSSSGKSRILYSSQGFVKPAGLMIDGKQVSVGLNVIAALR